MTLGPVSPKVFFSICNFHICIDPGLKGIGLASYMIRLMENQMENNIETSSDKDLLDCNVGAQIVRRGCWAA